MAYGDPGPAFHDMMVVDAFGTFFRVLVIAVGILIVFCSSEYLKREKMLGGAATHFALAASFWLPSASGIRPTVAPTTWMR